MIPEHRSSEILEDGNIAADSFAHSLSKCDTAAFDNDIYVFARTSEKAVAYISANHKGTHTLLLRHFGYYREYLMIQKTLNNRRRHIKQSFHCNQEECQ